MAQNTNVSAPIRDMEGDVSAERLAACNFRYDFSYLKITAGFNCFVQNSNFLDF